MTDAEPTLPPVVFAADDNYARPLCAALRSLAASNAAHLDALRVIVLHTSLSPSTARLLTAHAADVGLNLRLRRVDMDADTYPMHGWASSATYLRLALPDVLSDHDRAVYLDCDLLVLGDLAPLLTTDLGGAAIGAVEDVMNPVLGCGIGMPGWAELGLEADRRYFNCGVLVLDLDACRELFARALWFLANKPQHVFFWDQDALNWAADDQWFRLDRRWNMVALSAMLKMFGTPPCESEMAPLPVLLDDEKNARILHYAGPGKPWNDDYPPGPARDRYAAVLDAVDSFGS